MVSILVIVMSTPLAATVRLPKLVRQVPHKWIDARHPDWDTSGALQIEAAGSCDCFKITSQPEVNFRNSPFTAGSSIRRYRFGSCCASAFDDPHPHSSPKVIAPSAASETR